MAAAALAKVLRGGRSGLSSEVLPAIRRHVPQEGNLLGSSAATPTASMGRLMHTGQWRNPVLSQGGGSIPPKVEQFSSKRSLHWWRDDNVPTSDHPVVAVGNAVFLAYLVSFVFSIPTIYRSAKGLYKTFK
ncbi:unnamed protein product [Urochloa decumbens]|uniref:Uncharacterized protein n=1 Tax=Urochloa decumbens TaxID=240449 RepID=A0ABC8VIW3_9POAL